MNNLRDQAKDRKLGELNICILNHFGYALYYRSSDVHFGGAEVQLYLLAKYLAKFSKFNVNVITGDFEIQKRIIILNNEIIYVFLPTERSIKNIFMFFINLFTAYMKIKPDVIIQRTSGILVFILSIYSKLFRKKFIFSVASEKDINETFLKNIEGKLYKLGLKLSDLIILQNMNQKKAVKKLNLKLGKLKLIKSGHEIKNHNSIKEKEYILWVGSCIRIKNPELFLKLAKEFPREEFKIICSEYQGSSVLQKWKEIQKKSKEIQNLRYIKRVPFDKIDQYFKYSKIFINTSIYEGFPNTFIQALKFGTPIVSLNVNPDNFLIKNKCGFYCENNFSKMIEYVRILLNNKNLYQEYSENAFYYVKKNHNIEKAAEKWKKAILSLYSN